MDGEVGRTAGRERRAIAVISTSILVFGVATLLYLKPEPPAASPPSRPANPPSASAPLPRVLAPAVGSGPAQVVYVRVTPAGPGSSSPLVTVTDRPARGGRRARYVETYGRAP